MNSKLHAVCYSEGRPCSQFLTAGQDSDYTGAETLLSTLPPAKALLADKGYDADWFREALADRNYEACIPSKSNRKIQIPHDKSLYRKRNKMKNIFGKLKDLRRFYTLRAHTFMSTIAIAAMRATQVRGACQSFRPTVRAAGHLVPEATFRASHCSSKLQGSDLNYTISCN